MSSFLFLIPIQFIFQFTTFFHSVYLGTFPPERTTAHEIYVFWGYIGVKLRYPRATLFPLSSKICLIPHLCPIKTFIFFLTTFMNHMLITTVSFENLTQIWKSISMNFKLLLILNLVSPISEIIKIIAQIYV